MRKAHLPRRRRPWKGVILRIGYANSDNSYQNPKKNDFRFPLHPIPSISSLFLPLPSFSLSVYLSNSMRIIRALHPNSGVARRKKCATLAQTCREINVTKTAHGVPRSAFPEFPTTTRHVRSQWHTRCGVELSLQRTIFGNDRMGIDNEFCMSLIIISQQVFAALNEK